MKWLNHYSRLFLSRGYLKEGTSAEERIQAIAQRAEEILNKKGFAQKFFTYMEKGFYSLSTPIWANFGLPKGLPISCFGSHIDDNMSSILYAQSEVGMMSKFGGGTSGYFGALRSRGTPIQDNGISSGSVHFMHLFESMVNVVSQGSTRRGRFSPYLPIDHPDIEEFLNVGTEGNSIQELTHGVCIKDSWMQSMIEGDEKKRITWAKLIQRRLEIGYPYIFFEDTVNNNTVDVYQKNHLHIHHSNLCSEILLPTTSDWSFVCNLSSINLLHYDLWKETDAIETMIYFLDAVMSEFIEKLNSLKNSPKEEDQTAFFFMKRAYNFAIQNRALGLGVLGWHSYLQSKMIPWESSQAEQLNKEIFEKLQKKSYEASQQLSLEYGEPQLLKGIGRRNTTLNAIAPTTSSAFILGQVSQSIEPIWSNCYVKDISKLKLTIKNPFLEDLLHRKGIYTNDIWESIKQHDGSVQHLDCLTPHEKDVFKTFSEINPLSIVDQASQRQKFIDQGQSLNLMINPRTPAKTINQLYIYAWNKKIKTLYYQHSCNAAQEFSRSKMCTTACEA